MKRAFTLMELLVVIGIMGLLGLVSVGGYRAMQRGMEDRGALQNANTMIRAAYQRAQIDRQPTAVFFWNETLKSATADDFEVVVGKAVAIRRHGRFSDVRGGMLVDEFGDLNQTYPAEGDDEGGSSSASAMPLYVYPMERLQQIASGGTLRRSTVKGFVKNASENVIFLSGQKSGGTGGNSIPAWGFEIVDKGGVDWQPGWAYGMEFIHFELPPNYIFGSSYSSNVEDPVKGAGVLVFDVGVNSGNGITTGGAVGGSTVDICLLKPEGASMRTKKVGTAGNPERNL